MQRDSESLSIGGSEFLFCTRSRYFADDSARHLVGADDSVGPTFPAGTELPLNAVTPRLLLRRPTFSVAPEKVGKKMRLDAVYIARCRARFFDALFGRRFVTSPIAFNSGKCTTRICGQTASTSVLLISGILGRLRYCTAYCRGRCLHRPIGNLRIRRRFP